MAWAIAWRVWHAWTNLDSFNQAPPSSAVSALYSTRRTSSFLGQRLGSVRAFEKPRPIGLTPYLAARGIVLKLIVRLSRFPRLYRETRYVARVSNSKILPIAKWVPAVQPLRCRVVQRPAKKRIVSSYSPANGRTLDVRKKNSFRALLSVAGIPINISIAPPSNPMAISSVTDCLRHQNTAEIDP